MNKQTNKVKKPIFKKLILRIVLPLLIVYTFVLAYNLISGRKKALNDTREYLSELASNHACQLNTEFKEIAHAATSLALSMETFPIPDDNEIYKFIEKIIEGDPENIGTGLSFEPDILDNKKELFSPFVFKNDNEFTKSDLADSYNYMNESWYLIPKLLDKPYWTEPFFGKVSKSLLTTYTVPIHKDNKLIGIASADLSLNAMDKRMTKLNIMGGYSFIISKNGTFIYHPNQNFIMRESIFSLADEYSQPELRNLGRSMIAGNSGASKIKDGVTKEDKWLVYTTVPSTNWSFAAVIPEKNIMSAVNENVTNQLMIMLAGLILIVVILIWTSFSITQPVRKLQTLSSQLAEGNLDLQIEINTNDEIHALADSFNKMVKDLKHYIKDLTSATRAHEAVESELRIARQIQESLLPRIFPPFPDRKEFSLEAANIPAKEVAGDFYDFFFLDEKRLALIIADVSGKGIAAGLFMAVTRTLIKTVCQNCNDPAEALQRANKVLCQENDACMFTTLFLGIYQVESGLLQYANAGHNPPLIFNSNGIFKELITSKDMALGIYFDQEYHSHSIKIEKNELLLMFTDGVTEATSPENELFGEDRLISLMQTNIEKSVSEVVHILKDNLNDFQKDNQFDDITYLILRRNN